MKRSNEEISVAYRSHNNGLWYWANGSIEVREHGKDAHGYRDPYKACEYTERVLNGISGDDRTCMEQVKLGGVVETLVIPNAEFRGNRVFDISLYNEPFKNVNRIIVIGNTPGFRVSWNVLGRDFFLEDIWFFGTCYSVSLMSVHAKNIRLPRGVSEITTSSLSSIIGMGDLIRSNKDLDISMDITPQNSL